MTAARAATIGALAIVVALVAILLFRGNGAHMYKLTFQTAGQLVNDNDVQIGGRRIGSVKNIKLTDNNQAEIEIEVQEPYAPLHEGTTAVIRATSLSGVANRYIALSPGPDSAPKLADGTVLAADKTTTIVDLDQLFNTLDEPTRKGLTDTIKGFATWYVGKGLKANQAAQVLRARALVDARRDREAERRHPGARRPGPGHLEGRHRARQPERDADRPRLQRRHQPRRDRQRHGVALAGDRAAAGDAAPREHDVRRPATRPGRPRQARRRLEARDEEPRAVPGDAAAAPGRVAADAQAAVDAAAPAWGRATTSRTC